MRRLFFLTFLLVIIPGSLNAFSEHPKIGSSVTEIEGKDLDGKIWRLKDRPSDQIVVVAFLKADCPLAELYAPRLVAISQDYGSRGVEFVCVASDSAANITDLKRFVNDHNLPFPIFIDPDNHLADLVGAARTPEVIVIDQRRVIRYRGRIDDQYAIGSRKPEPKRRDLVLAIEEILAGRPVTVPQTESIGCPINRHSLKFSPDKITYSREIAPILQRRCVECHRPGQVGPFSLMTYGQTAGWAESIAAAVDDGRMPPWYANPKFGHFANDSRLTVQEKKLISEWVAAGVPEGDSADLPPPPKFIEGWRISMPDQIIEMKQPYAVPAEGVVDYQYFEIDPGFTEDKWIAASEIQPGNRRVVHHCNVFLKNPASRTDMDETGELGSYCLDAMTPGSPPMILPAGTAKRIPAGWHLLFVVHYSPIGTKQVDQTRIGLVFADPKNVRQEVATNLIADPNLRIPPGEANHRVEQSRHFNDDVLLLAMFPHMHLRGKSFRYEATYPDGNTEILLDVPHYDFRWQNRYELAQPKRLPAGTSLRCIAAFDNSAANPDNPNPAVEVRTGKQSWEEMFNGYYDVVLADEDRTMSETLSHRINRIRREATRWATRFSGLLFLIPAWLLWKKIRRDQILRTS